MFTQLSWRVCTDFFHPRLYWFRGAITWQWIVPMVLNWCLLFVDASKKKWDHSVRCVEHPTLQHREGQRDHPTLDEQHYRKHTSNYCSGPLHKCHCQENLPGLFRRPNMFWHQTCFTSSKKSVFDVSVCLYPSVWLSVCLSVRQSVRPWIYFYLSIYLSIFRSIYLSIHLSVQIQFKPCNQIISSLI